VPERFNLLEGKLSFDHEQEGFRWRASRLGPLLGAALIGGTVYELDAGERTFPYHFHHGEEEWLLVLSGTPGLRTPEGERTLKAGDVVCFPEGPDGAHVLRGPGRVLILSADREPNVTEYPDSDKVKVWPPGKVFRQADAVDYWDGE
jgi:uncharacterized cupin superfamily protein